jgi:TRAP-type C4-dicarboxylate transport system substrate-binding protein
MIVSPSLLLSIAGALWLFTSPAIAKDKTFDLKLAHWLPPSHPVHSSIDQWGKSIETASGGTIKFKIYPAQQLGKAFDHYDLARDGIADLAFVVPGYQPGRFPVFDAANLPLLITNAKEGSVAVDEWYRKYATKEMKDVKFCLAFVHDPGTFHSRTKKIQVPTDVAGLKIRPSTSAIATLVAALGGSNVNAPAPEVRDLMEKGTIDATTLPWGSVPYFGIDKVTKYHLDVPLYTSGFVWIMNLSTYNAMSSSQKAVIDNHCSSEWALKFASPWADFDSAGLPKLKSDPAHEVYGISPEHLAEWRKVADPVVKAWEVAVKKANSDDPAEVMKDLVTTLKKHNSAY